MGKRKAKELDNGAPVEEPRRSSRQKSTKEEAIEAPVVASKAAKKSKTSHKESPAASKKDKEDLEDTTNKSTSPVITSKIEKANGDAAARGRRYWLMKAEPESRIEKGKDIKFSIDDLASKKEPEPWDGIRNYVARNNLRDMKKGDLAFFYHSSCKVPAIVGIMEIVQEHSPDLTAHDPKAPYYDAKSKPENPLWSVVHVEFRQKLKTPVTLKDLRDLQSKKESPLQNMQMLKTARLSVSKVSVEEWDFLTSVIKENGDEVFS